MINTSFHRSQTKGKCPTPINAHRSRRTVSKPLTGSCHPSKANRKKHTCACCIAHTHPFDFQILTLTFLNLLLEHFTIDHFFFSRFSSTFDFINSQPFYSSYYIIILKFSSHLPCSSN